MPTTATEKGFIALYLFGDSIGKAMSDDIFSLFCNQNRHLINLLKCYSSQAQLWKQSDENFSHQELHLANITEQYAFS